MAGQRENREWAPLGVACTYIGRSPSVLYRWSALGLLRTMRNVEGRLLYHLGDLRQAQQEDTRNHEAVSA